MQEKPQMATQNDDACTLHKINNIIKIYDPGHSASQITPRSRKNDEKRNVGSDAISQDNVGNVNIIFECNERKLSREIFNIIYGTTSSLNMEKPIENDRVWQK